MLCRAVREILTKLDTAKGVAGGTAAASSMTGSKQSSASSLAALDQPGGHTGGTGAAFPAVSAPSLTPTGAPSVWAHTAAPKQFRPMSDVSIVMSRRPVASE